LKRNPEPYETDFGVKLPEHKASLRAGVLRDSSRHW